MKRRYLRRNPANYLTVADIQRIVGMHPNTIRSWLHDELLPYITGVKGEFLVRKRDLQKFFKQYYDEELDIE